MTNYDAIFDETQEIIEKKKKVSSPTPSLRSVTRRIVMDVETEFDCISTSSIKPISLASDLSRETLPRGFSMSEKEKVNSRNMSEVSEISPRNSSASRSQVLTFNSFSFQNKTLIDKLHSRHTSEACSILEITPTESNNLNEDKQRNGAVSPTNSVSSESRLKLKSLKFTPPPKSINRRNKNSNI